ncbi:MAG: adenine nucleotide alpha hydrolase [Verrucomicrobia bacterium]|nr:adenine nucleotide alpha hydrolase [Verrucomicrobiota bacterium]
MEGRLNDILRNVQPVAIAVSGGVDSLTLATLAHRVLPDGASAMFHAVSPAVPEEASARVRALAQREGWSLTVFDAGEFGNENYRSNPVNRCFHCKHSLYEAIHRLTDATILSGANQDDLGEYRPGLEAARLFRVRHPYVEAGLAKADVRALAARLGLGNIADLPAAPCLASRVESGIRIEADTLRLIHRVEQAIAASLKPQVVRCRVRRGAIVIELDPQTLGQLSIDDQDRLTCHLRSLPDAGVAIPPGTAVRYERYRVGSAFLHT